MASCWCLGEIVNYFCINSNEANVESYFKGYAFTGSSMVMNLGGYEKYVKENGRLFDHIEDGRFVLFEKSGEFFNLRADPSGQNIIYYFSDANFWVVTDSLLQLSKVLASYGIERAVYQPSVDVFKNERLSLIGGQLVSNNTVLKNVKVLGLNEYIQLSWGKKKDNFQVKNLPSKKVYSDYEELLYNFISSWRGRLGVISNLQKKSYLALSGGLDSRALLALWDNSSANEKLNCHSHKKIEHEYEIAKQLCDLSGQCFGPGMKGLSSKIVSAQESYELSMLGNASVKTNFGFRRVAIKDPQIHFIGGCAIGSFYMKSSYKARAARLVKQFGEAGENVANEILISLKSLNVDEKDPWAMFHHYYNFRARYHYGNEVHTQYGAIQVQPLLDSTLHQVSSLVKKDYVEGNGVIRDVISAASSKLLGVSFDSPGKVKSDSIQFSQKLSSIEPREYTCYDGDVRHFANFYGSKGMTESEWYSEFRNILASKKRPMVELASELGFSDSYIDQAIAEVDAFSKGSRMKKSGVLLGLHEVFNS